MGRSGESATKETEDVDMISRPSGTSSDEAPPARRKTKRELRMEKRFSAKWQRILKEHPTYWKT